jgi:hypothetical protein
MPWGSAVWPNPESFLCQQRVVKNAYSCILHLRNAVWPGFHHAGEKGCVFIVASVAAKRRKSLACLLNAEKQDGSHHELKSVDGIHGATNERFGNRFYGNTE